MQAEGEVDAIAKFSKHVVETGYDDLSSEAISATKTFLLDTIGVAVAGSAGPWVEELVSASAIGGRRITAASGYAAPNFRRRPQLWRTPTKSTIRNSTACTRPRWCICKRR